MMCGTAGPVKPMFYQVNGIENSVGGPIGSFSSSVQSVYVVNVNMFLSYKLI